MGTTADKLQYLIDAKSSISAAIEAKGGTVPQELSGYGAAIQALPSGGGSSYSEEMASQLRAKNEKIKIFQQELPQELIAVKFKNYSQTYTSGTSQIIDTGWTYISGVTSLGDAQFTLIGSLPKALSGLNSVGKVSSDVDALVYYENDVYNDSANRIRSDGTLTGNTSFAARIPEVRYLDIGCMGGVRTQDGSYSPFKNLSKLETLVFSDNIPMNATPKTSRVGDKLPFWNMEGCTSLKDVVLSRKVYLGYYYTQPVSDSQQTPTWTDTKLSSIYISDERISYGGSGGHYLNDYLGAYFFKGATHLKNLRIPGSIEEICYGALSGMGTSDDPNEPWELSVELGDIAYKDADGSVLWPGVTKIGSKAFADCTHLLYVVLPSSVTSLSAGVATPYYGGQFENCGSAAEPQEFTLDCRKLHNPPSFSMGTGYENITCVPSYGKILVKDADYDNWISVMDANGWTTNAAKVVKESEF